MGARVFLSYNKADRAMAETVAQSLARSGVETWLDLDVAAGSNWIDELRTKLQQSDAFVAIVSDTAGDSSFMGVELGAAKALDKRILLITQGDTALRAPYSGLDQSQSLNAGGMSPDEIASTIQARLPSIAR